MIRNLTVALVIVGAGLGQAANADGAKEDNVWPGIYRKPANDGVNCLYLQLRALGYNERYDAFRARLPDSGVSLSLSELAQAGKRFGFRLVPLKLSLSELAQNTPAIVYFEEGGVGKGHYYLLVHIDEVNSAVAIVNGAYVTRNWMARDQFRRNWTGYALVARPSSPPWGSYSRRCAAGLALIGAIAWFGRWLGRRRIQSPLARTVS